MSGFSAPASQSLSTAGNTSVGKIICRAAAEHLTPCIMELGGKNPVFVTAKVTAPRVPLRCMLDRDDVV